MWNVKQALFGEKSVTKVAGLYSSGAAARQDAQALIADSQLDDWQVSVLGPIDEASADAANQRLLPEDDGIMHTLIRAHVTMGVLGLAVGAAVAASLLAGDNPALRDVSGFVWAAALMIGGVMGLLVGGAISLRPDQGRLITEVHTALKQGQWAVVAHPVDRRQTDEALASLNGHSLRVMRSF